MNTTSMRKASPPAPASSRLWWFVLVVALALPSTQATAATREEIDLHSEEALTKFFQQTSAGKELADRAKGMLIFPRVYKAGFGFGGEYGEGKLIVGGRTEGYYNIASASVGFQLGAQRKAQLILFMTDDALAQFRATEGWKAGVDGSVALATLGAGGGIDSNTLREPVIGFIFSNEGLMYNLTFEGSKISRLDK